MNRIRPALASALVAVIALLGVHGTAVSATAAPVIDPATITTIEIHKLEQPDALGQPATGLPQDTTGLVPVAGATFTATRVPGIDVTTNAGQQAAAALTAADAGPLVAGLPADASATTGAAGEATLTPLGVGLYYVRETSTPAGFIPAAPFLVTLPLTDPDTRDNWLTTVHVYPKNAHVGIELDVRDQDAVAVGDTVSWRARAGIPVQPSIDGYRITQTVAPGLTLDAGGIQVALDCGATLPSCPTLVPGVDYVLTVDPSGTGFVVDVTGPGRAVLAAAVQAHPGASVVVDFPTTVTADGAYVNTATLAATRATIDGDPGAPAVVADTAATRWGPLAILVREAGHPQNLIPGARFKLYLTPEDAAAGVNAVVVGGTDTWVSDQHGRVDISGLRFSDFVNGLQRDPTDPLYRNYYVRLTELPDGYLGSLSVLSVAVTSTTEPQLVVVELRRSGGSLPWTGAQVAGVGAAAVALLAAGVLFLIAARRRRREDAEAS
ncbi:MAG: SpaH/EbpB family LPXTG-anchored major pilin [Micrococcales bacterium]|nr:SpaH/EbpB family LPXTG-anchored major pilin [Micrococcales bacterium]OJX69497.1 MAG: hypothetical protein BGO94_13370 [Micrococcales bacterium 72-143]